MIHAYFEKIKIKIKKRTYIQGKKYPAQILTQTEFSNFDMNLKVTS